MIGKEQCSESDEEEKVAAEPHCESRETQHHEESAIVRGGWSKILRSKTDEGTCSITEVFERDEEKVHPEKASEERSQGGRHREADESLIEC